MATSFAQIINKYQDIAPKQIINAVKTAAIKTGTDFSFLMEKAAAESNFKADSTAKTSSATGLFQFIESTWLDMVKQHGSKYGLSSLASHIEDKNGKLCVDNCDVKDKILELRKDPKVASFMAAEFSAANKKYLENNTAEKVGATELYLAHFMGAKGATDFINQKTENGDAIAANLFPKEAKANKNVFFDKQSGKARSLNEVYNFFDKKFTNNEIKFKDETSYPSYVAFQKSTDANKRFVSTVPAHIPPYPTLKDAQALLPFNENSKNYSNYTTAFSDNFNTLPQKISAEAILMMAQMQMHRHTALI